MKTATAFILVLTFLWAWAEIRRKSTQDNMNKMELSKDSIIDLKTDTISVFRYKALLFDSANAKTERAYIKLEKTMGSAPLKHGRQN